MVISESDARLVTAFIKAEVFQKIKKEHLQGNQTIAILCGDCIHSGDIIDHHREVCGHAPHILALNGGSLLIPKNSPLNGASVRGNILIEDIVESVEFKGIKKIIIYAHNICGKAHGVRLSFRDSVALHVGAKRRLKQSRLICSRLEAQEPSIYCFHHVFFPNGDRKTFFISPPHWDIFSQITEGLSDEEICTRYEV